MARRVVMRPAPPEVVLEIERWNLKKRLPILVRTSDSGWTGYRKIGAPGSQLEYAEVSPSILVHVETNVFRVMIKDESPKLSSEAPALYELRKKTDEAERTLKRTVKMLDCLEALFFEPFVPPLAGERSALHEVITKLKIQVPALHRALRQLSTKVVPLADAGSWGYYVPLLMVVAVAFSQCECHLPVFWQAYSAGRAKGDLKERWPEIDEWVLDFIALLIRCQSCYGQLSRGSGDRRFFPIIEEFAGATPHFNSELLHSALRVMSVLEDLRHHRISHYAPDAPSHKEGGPAWEEPSWFKLTAGCYGPLAPRSRSTRSPERFRNRKILLATLRGRLEVASTPKVLAQICARAGMTPEKRISELFRRQRGAAYTWGYASGLNVRNEEMRRFKNYIEENLPDLLDRPEVDRSQIAMLSFDRTQAADLTKVLAHNVRVVAKRPDSIRERFHLQAIEIPNCRGGTRPEYVIEVSLNDDLAAEALLFPHRRAPGSREVPIGDTAGALFGHLFRMAVEELDLRNATLHERQNCYVPVPLVRRLLNVTYKLRPETCRSVRITYQPNDFEVVHLPLGLDQPEDHEVIQCVAHYIHAVILNRAMSQGFEACDLDLEGLRDSGWPERIAAAYEANGYNVLLESYLGQYNTERASSVQLLSEMQTGSLRRVAVTQLREKLHTFLTQPSWAERNPYIFLGIDIGGTLTKFQFYEFDPEALEFCRKGDTFRILTAPKADSRSAAAVPAESRNLATDFASRLVKTIADNLGRDPDLREIRPTSIVAIGLSWPGPVRANRVAGTSGIFKNFPPLSGVIKQNPMEDIHRLDVAGAFYEAWCHLSSRTSIALLNDGSADGTGAIYELMPPDRESGKGTLAVVKLGTGTAGALFASERLGAGLYEWGKLLLDVGAPPDRTFPKGTANGYLSTRTMPRLARRPPSDLLDIDDLDSLELGLLLEAGAKNFDRESYQKLREECGIIEFASRGGLPGMDAEVIRRVRDKGLKAEPELFGTIELYVECLGLSAHKRLVSRVELYGDVRLERLLGLSGEDLRRIRKTWVEIQGRLRCKHEVAVRCASALGCYLGDFLVLLHDSNDVRTVIVGGGVLSGCTGELVRRHAVERVRRYGLECEAEGAILSLGRKDAQTAGLSGGDFANRPRSDLGTLGAAVFAAGEFLFARKQEGMREIKARLTGLLGNQSVMLQQDSLLCDGQDPVPLSRYALDMEDVKDFLKQCSTDLGFRRSTVGDPARIVYTRWIREN